MVVVPGVMVVGGVVGMLVIVVGGRSPQKKGQFFSFSCAKTNESSREEPQKRNLA